MRKNWQAPERHFRGLYIWQGMIVRMCRVVLRVLCIVVLVGARCTTNAMAQKCKVLHHPIKCVLICGCKYKVKGHHIMSRVWTFPVLHQVRWKLEVVPIWMGNLCFSVSPPQACMMSLPKKSKNCNPKLCVSINSKVTCRINCQALGCCVYLLW